MWVHYLMDNVGYWAYYNETQISIIGLIFSRLKIMDTISSTGVISVDAALSVIGQGGRTFRSI